MLTLEECRNHADPTVALATHIRDCEVWAYEDFMASTRIVEQAHQEGRRISDSERERIRSLAQSVKGYEDEIELAKREYRNALWSEGW